MKNFRAIALLLAVTWTIAYQSRQSSIYAATAAPDATPATASRTTALDGAQVFQQNCAVCHGEKMQGIQPSIPPLAGVGHRMNSQQIALLVHHGRGRMPAFNPSQLSNGDLASLLRYLAADKTFTTVPLGGANQAGGAAVYDSGGSIYQQNCAFCHGRDTAGGETGPDLTRSKLVASDVKGDKISSVVRNGRGDGKMPKFNLSESELADLVRFIHAAAKLAASNPGGRRGVDVADLQTGNADAGKKYFQGNCSSCHSATGDLAGIAARYQGLELERQMLYPKDVQQKVTVTLPSGESVVGILAYQDEFHVGLREASGIYRSWPVKSVKYSVDSSVDGHVELFPKYTDDDIHNLMAYMQTLK